MKRSIRITVFVIAAAAALSLFPQAGIRAAVVNSPDAAAGASVDIVRHVPTVEDLMALKSAGSPRISPDGRRVAYTVAETDFDQDAYVTQIWLADVASGRTVQLTRGKKSSSGPTWSPDGRWIAFTSSRADDKSQIFAISPDGGEAIQLTKAETGVGGFDWSPDGKAIAFLASDPVPEEAKARKDFYGDYDVVRREYTHRHLWTVDVAEALSSPQPGKRRTSGKAFNVNEFDWSPDGTKIAFGATINPDLINGGTSDIYVLDLAEDKVRKIVDQPGPDSSPLWSPDGRSILFLERAGPERISLPGTPCWPSFPAEGGSVRPLTASLRRERLGGHRMEQGRNLFLGHAEDGRAPLPARSRVARRSNA